MRLFQRHARAVALSDEGLRFYEEVRPLLAGIECAARVASSAAEALSGRLRVSVDAPFGHFVLAPSLGIFLAAHPDLSVELTVRDQLGDLVADGFDVAIRFGKAEGSGLIARKLFETPVMTCASPEYVARRGSPRHPHDLVQLLPDWCDERYPLYAYLPAKRLLSTRVRAFLDFASSLTRIQQPRPKGHSHTELWSNGPYIDVDST